MGKFRPAGTKRTSRKDWSREQRKKAGRRVKAKNYTTAARQYARRHQVSYDEGKRMDDSDRAHGSRSMATTRRPDMIDMTMSRIRTRSANRRQAKRVPMLFRRFTKTWGI